MTSNNRVSPETKSAQALRQTDPTTGGITPAIHTAATYTRGPDYRLTNERHGYGRDDNPSHAVAENLLAELEGGPSALLFASGMAAATAVLQTLKPGDHVVAPRIMYWGLRNGLIRFCEQWGLGLDLFDAANPDTLAGVLREGETKLVWIETPCNPSWDIIDISAAARIAHDAGARLAVDSTVATPVLTRPIEHGADIVMHSATKYLNGHCDVVAGALVSAREDGFWQRIRDYRLEAGALLGYFEAWLLQRGMRTLFLRVRKACESAQAIAEHFQGHPAVRQVMYPGLPRHPGHAIARRQMDGGFGGMMTLQVRGGERAALDVAGRCRLFTRATSLGGVESLIEHRRTIEGNDSPVPGDWLRLSIGIESVEDLIADLEQAMRE